MRSIATIVVLLALSACGKKAPEAAAEATATAAAAVTADSEAKATVEAEPCDKPEAEARPDVATASMHEDRELPKTGCPEELEPVEAGPIPIE